MSPDHVPNLENATSDADFREAGRQAHRFQRAHKWNSLRELAEYHHGVLSWALEQRNKEEMTVGQYNSFKLGWKDGVAEERERTMAEAEKLIQEREQAKKANEPTALNVFAGALFLVAIFAGFLFVCRGIFPDTRKMTDEEYERYEREMWELERKYDLHPPRP